jgi:membrane-associated phospholipid phosphatase
LPGTLCSFLVAFVMCAAILAQPWIFVHRFYKVTYYLVAYLLLGATVWYQCFDGGVREMYYSFTNNHDFNMNTDHFSLLYSFLMTAGFMGVSSLLIIFKFKQRHVQLFKWAIFAIIVISISWLIMVLMKNNLPRDRYLALFDSSNNFHQELFKPWYSLLWNQSSGGGFLHASFPSGHTTWAVTLLLLVPLAATVFEIKKGWQIVIICLIAALTILTMYARISAGYHYLSDTAASLLLISSCITAGYAVFYKFNWIH